VIRFLSGRGRRSGFIGREGIRRRRNHKREGE